jgi:hypothetical protein
LKDKYLFIQFMFLEKECDIPFKLNYYDFYYEIFMLGKRGVTLVGRVLRRTSIFGPSTFLKAQVPARRLLEARACPTERHCPLASI